MSATQLEGDLRIGGGPPVPDLANTKAAQRARRQATLIASLAAVVPTVLAMQGMSSLAIDVLGFPVLAAIALAGFLELALVSSALLARASALAGRPGGADGAAVWAVSVVSGTLAATHELVGTSVGGVRDWDVGPASLLAAGVRVAAPLVAAWLWERVLTAARREHDVRTLVELRRDRRMLRVARAALAVRRLEVANEASPGRWHASRVRRARRRMDRAHFAALRTVQPGSADLPTWLAAVGAVDVLPAGTIVRDLDVWSAVGQASQREPGSVLAAGSPDQGEPVQEPNARPEWPIPVHQVAPLVEQPATEPVAAPQPEPPLADQLNRVPADAAAEAATRVAAVLDLAAQGLSQRAIATRLGISRSTVARAIARGDAGKPSADAPSPRETSHQVAHEVEQPATEPMAGPKIGPPVGQAEPPVGPNSAHAGSGSPVTGESDPSEVSSDAARAPRL